METMKTTLFCILIALLPLSANATGEVSGVRVIECTAQRKGDLIDLNFLLDCSGVTISPNEQLEVQPVLAGESDTLRLPSLLFTGNIRDKVNHRQARFHGEVPAGYAKYNMKQLADARRNKVAYSRQVPFRDWMYGSRVILKNKVTGCAECQRDLADVPMAYIPHKLAVSYLVPQPEQKTRRKNVSLYLNFHQGKAEILPDYMNNRAELAKTDSLIAQLASDSYIVVDSIRLIGYASPEGKYDYNTRLSGQRAEALKAFLEKIYTPKGYILTTFAASEDWDGLYESIRDGILPYRTQILSIIDSIPDPDARDNYIRQLDGGVTYNNLLQNLYPPLRRVVCDARYIVKPFTTEQAKQRLATDPDQLSLNEMYLIAQSYPVGSPRFKALFNEMLLLYPDNAIAKNNLAAVALDAGNIEQAQTCLESIRQLPEAQNNLGVLLYRQGKVDEAKHCFERACARGCKEAAYNLQEINALMAIH